MADYKSIIVFIIIFAVLIIFTFYLMSNSKTNNISKSPSNTVSRPNKTQSNSSSSSNQIGLPLPNPPSNNTKSSVNTEYGCPSNKSTILIFNGNFSKDTFNGWTVSGPGFGSSPLNLQLANQNGDYYQHKWSNYNGQYAATTYHQPSSLSPGNLSVNFVVVEPYLDFQITSPQNNDLYVEMLFDNVPVIINHYDTLGTSSPVGTFESATLNMSSLLCKSVTLRIVSNVYDPLSSEENQFIGVGNFYQSRSPSQSGGVIVTSSLK